MHIIDYLEIWLHSIHLEQKNWLLEIVDGKHKPQKKDWTEYYWNLDYEE